MDKIEDNKPQSCPRCGYLMTVRHGFCLTKKWGNQQRRQCKKCASIFYEKYKEMEAKK